MKKFIAVVLLVLITLSLFACAPNEQTSQPSTTGSTAVTTTTSSSVEIKDLKIGVSMNQLNTSRQEWLDYCLAYAKEIGLNVIYTNADKDIDKQISDVESLIAMECDAIVVCAIDPDAICPVIDKCKEAGIPVIGSDYQINSDNLAGLLYMSQFQIGAAQGKYLAKVLNENPELVLNVGYLWGNLTMKDAKDRYNGAFSELKSFMDTGRVKILDEQLANWQSDEATKVTENWLVKYIDMNCIIAGNDDMANGAIQALKAVKADFDKWYICGINATSVGKQNVLDGYCDCTVFMDLKYVAQESLNMAIKAVAEGKIYGKVDCAAEAVQPLGYDEVLAMSKK